MARTGSKMAKKKPKMVKNGQFSKILECGVGNLNLSQEISDKLKNESGQFFFTEQRKRQKIVKTDHFFSDLLDVYYDPNEQIDMNPI